MSLSLRTILLPFDGSAPAKAAAAHARVLAAGSGATVVLVYVLPGSDLLSDFGVGPAAARDATALLVEAARAFPGRTEVRLLEGDPADALAAEATRLDADLVVLGSRGRSPLAGLVLGSTARKVLNLVERPVLVAHVQLDAIRNVVAGVEEGPAAARVAGAAAGIAAATNAKVSLVNVIDADRELVDAPERFGIPADLWKDAVGRHAERVFAPLRAVAPGAAEVVRYGRANVELREAAESLGAEILVVARKGRSGLDVDAWFSVAFGLAVRGPFATLVV